MGYWAEIERSETAEPFSFSDLIEGYGYGFGVYDDNYRLQYEQTGDETIVYDPQAIGRGVTVTIEDEGVLLQLPLPATRSDVEVFWSLIDRAMTLTKASDFTWDEDTYHACDVPSLRNDLLAASKGIFENTFQDDSIMGNETLMIFGACFPVALRPEELKAMGANWELYGERLHAIQNRDVFYAAPLLMSKRNDEGEEVEIVGIYVLTSELDTALPFLPRSGVFNPEIEVDRWLIGFVDQDNVEKGPLGLIPYEDFLRVVNKDDQLDASRFVVRLALKEILPLLDEFETEL